MLGGRLRTAARACSEQSLAELDGKGGHTFGVPYKALAVPVEMCFQEAHEGAFSRLLGLNPSFMTFVGRLSLQ